MTNAPPWRPFSLDPARTLTAFVGTLVPLVVIVVGSALPPVRRRWLAGVVVLSAWIVVVFGLKRLIAPTAYDLAHATGAAQIDRLGGLIANSNTTAMFFVSCLLLLVGVPGQGRRIGGSDTWRVLLRTACSVVLVLCTLLTKSRTGVALLVLPLGLFVLKLLVERFGRGTARAKRLAVPLLAVGLGLAALGSAVAFTGGGQLGAVFERMMSATDGKRKEINLDALQAAQRYWPAGAGMGTFDEVFQVDESLEYLSPRRTGRAHQEYYEMALEAGLVALALAASWALWVGIATCKALRTWDWAALAGAAILAGCAAQSLVLFPLRTQTMLTVAALAVLLLLRPAPGGAKVCEGAEAP